MKNRGLGRGLEALLGSDDNNMEQSNDQLKMISIGKLSAGKYQPRSIMDPEPLEELAESIKSQGIMQPILVRMLKENDYEIVAGERRWRAAKLAKLTEVPVLIKKISDSSALAMALIENIQREDLNIIEEAKGIKRLIDEFGMTHDAAAESLGKSRTAVSNILRLLNLSDYVQDALLNKKIEMGHARALLSLGTSEQAMVCQKVISQKLSVREVEILVANQRKGPKKIKTSDGADIKVLENDMSEILGMGIKILHNKNGKGTLKINYSNLDQFDMLLKKLKN
ncbi:ParB/RepB/Spo0J family partition protein [Methylophilaceae bacterium]|nr:ParB/RepB/Spo0J family partition protein [Methylophilaceae bacterium]